MYTLQQSLRGMFWRAMRIISLLVFAAFSGGCASFYVDTMLKDVTIAQMKKVEHPQPVQLLFEFQTKGASNGRATQLLKEDVVTHTKNSGLFADVSDTPVAGGAILSITVDNVPLTQDAAARGFVTGLTFGLAGNTVTDGYICTVTYLKGAGAEKVSKSVKHAIHTSLGAQSAPANAVASDSIEAAVRTMLRQVVSNALNDLASDPKFQ